MPRNSHVVEWIAILVRRRGRTLGSIAGILETNSLPQEITRDKIIFPYQGDIVHDTRTYVRRPGDAVYWLFSIWKENIRLCTQLTADRLTAGNSNSALYIGLTRGRGGRKGRGWHPVTRQTSDGSGINGEY